MAQRQASKTERKRDRQSISVPFLWEEKPGTPKRDWKPTARPIKPVEVPVKLVVSVPFGWEEKPGTPLPLLSPPPNVPMDTNLDCFGGEFNEIDHNRHDYEMDALSDSDLETCSFQTDESFSSAPSLLANGLISTVKLARAVPVEKTTIPQTIIDDYPVSDTESTASSYEIGSTSLAGASFLEWLFPLLMHNSNSANKVKIPENDPFCAAEAHKGSEFASERNGSHVRRPLLTLGEMIVMSRRRSCQRKVMNMRRQTSMDFMKRSAFGCGILGGCNGISALNKKWKRHLQLKLM